MWQTAASFSCSFTVHAFKSFVVRFANIGKNTAMVRLDDLFQPLHFSPAKKFPLQKFPVYALGSSATR
jgi:hypothetical protein